VFNTKVRDIVAIHLGGARLDIDDFNVPVGIKTDIKLTDIRHAVDRELVLQYFTGKRRGELIQSNFTCASFYCCNDPCRNVNEAQTE